MATAVNSFTRIVGPLFSHKEDVEKHGKNTSKKILTIWKGFDGSDSKPVNQSNPHFMGFDIDNSMAKTVQKDKVAASNNNKKLNNLLATSDVLTAAHSLTPFTSDRMFAKEVTMSNSVINVFVAVFGFLGQFFSKKSAQKTTFNEAKGDLSAEKIAKYGQMRFGARFIGSSFGLAAGIGAYTGLNQISGRAVFLAGSFCSSIAMGCFFLIAKERSGWIQNVREEFEKIGIEGIRNKLVTISEEDIQYISALVKESPPIDLSEKTQKLENFRGRNILPHEVIERFQDKIELLEGIETFMLARRDHYARFMGQNNIHRILKNSEFEYNSKNVSYFKNEELLVSKIQKTLKIQSTLWKVVQIFSLLTICVSTISNYIAAGIPQIVMGILNLAIAIGWSIVDTYFFITDMLEGGFTKDQFYAFLVTQTSFILLTAGALFIHPLANLATQASLMAIGLSGILYNLIVDLKKKPKIPTALDPKETQTN